MGLRVGGSSRRGWREGTNSDGYPAVGLRAAIFAGPLRFASSVPDPAGIFRSYCTLRSSSNDHFPVLSRLLMDGLRGAARLEPPDSQQ